MSRPTILHVLTGPTAVGKTELALQWAERHGAEILSCDSLLFYRGMDIGTAKPTAAERARVRHHLVDVCAPEEPMDVVQFVERARAVVGAARGPLLVTGGSGFYLKAFFGPVSDGIQVSDTLRASVEELWRTGGLPALLGELRTKNPRGLGSLDTANPRRVQRALERCLASGRELLELQAEFSRLPGPFAEFPVRWVVLGRPLPELQERVARRVSQMLEQGLVAEVERLRAAGFTRNPSAAGAIGYRETMAYLEGKMTLAELAPAIVANTRALVRKQHTWFRTQLPPHCPVHPGAVSAANLFEGDAVGRQ